MQFFLLRSLMAEGTPTSGIERRMLMKMTTSNSWLVSGELFYILMVCMWDMSQLNSVQSLNGPFRDLKFFNLKIFYAESY